MWTSDQLQLLQIDPDATKRIVRLIKEQSIWCALKVIMMIDTPIGSPNWAAHTSSSAKLKRSPCLLPTKTCSVEPEGSFPSSVFPDAHNWHHNNSTIFNSAIAICVFTRKDYPGSARDHPPEIGRPFEGWRCIWRCRQEGLRSCKVCEAGGERVW